MQTVQELYGYQRELRAIIRRCIASSPELTDEFFEKQAAEGHDLKSLPTLVRALDTAKDYELPLLLGSIEAIINAAPEAYFVLKAEHKAKIARYFSSFDMP